MNFKPDSLCYDLIVKGKLDESHPEYAEGFPAKQHYDDTDFQFKTAPLRSAYKEALGSEPEFTNNAQVQQQPPFVECLDYVFVSPHWKVQGANETSQSARMAYHRAVWSLAKYTFELNGLRPSQCPAARMEVAMHRLRCKRACSHHRCHVAPIRRRCWTVRSSFPPRCNGFANRSCHEHSAHVVEETMLLYSLCCRGA
jgi:hypothetical protein